MVLGEILLLHLWRVLVEWILSDHVVHLEIAHRESSLVLRRYNLGLEVHHIRVRVLELLLGVVHHVVRLECVGVFHFLDFLADHFAASRGHELLELFVGILGVVIFNNFS